MTLENSFVSKSEVSVIWFPALIPVAGKLSSKRCDRWRRASCNQFHWSRWKRGPVRRQPRYQTKIDEGQSAGANARTYSRRRHQLLPRSFLEILMSNVVLFEARREIASIEDTLVACAIANNRTLYNSV